VGREPATRAEAANPTPANRRHASVHRAARIASVAVSFTLLLLYTHYLSPADFGTLVLLYVTLRLLDTLVVQGLTTAVVRAAAIDFRDDAAARREAVSTAFYYCALSAGVVFGGLALLAGPVSHWIFGAAGWRICSSSCSSPDSCGRRRTFRASCCAPRPTATPTTC